LGRCERHRRRRVGGARKEEGWNMPNRSARPCLGMCGNLVRGRSRCPSCARKVEEQRGRPEARGYDRAWRRLRAAHLARHPYCVTPGCGRLGNQVDHIKAHREDEALRLDPRNLQTLCHSCHSRKTVERDGGFGRSASSLLKIS
jgi:5-methylcytosine-specific restriction protein A